MKKVIGIFIMTLLIGTVIPVIGTNLNEVEVPEWEVGDSWTYACTFYSSTPDESMYFDVSFDLIFKVVDETNELYILEGESESLTGMMNLLGLDLKYSRFIKYNVDIKIKKSNLGIVYHKYTTYGICFPAFGGIPLPIPIYLDFSLETEFYPEFLITPFPLSDGKEGSTFNTMMTQNIKLSMFKIMTLYEVYGEVAPLGPYHYECNENQVTTEAGTFDVYNMTMFGGGDEYYINYASEVGNLAKLHVKINHGTTDILYMRFTLELKSTNY